VPTYQYACTECGEQLEAVQKFTDDPLTTCEACGGRLRKVFSPVGIVFKGSGFYRTDSRNGAAAGTDKDKAKSASGSGSGESGSSDKADKSAKADKSESPAAATPAKPSKSAEKAA
jgi:putative FmdB family regulatory protein